VHLEAEYRFVARDDVVVIEQFSSGDRHDSIVVGAA
jgi:hypothetical protein